MLKKATRVFLLNWLILTNANLPPDEERTSDTTTHDQQSYFPEHLSDLLHEICPYTDICGEPASREFPKDPPGVSVYTKKIPCCRPCSCNKNCGSTMSCCFEHLDEYKLVEKYSMSCIRVHPSTRNPLASYYMVDTCLNDSSTDCTRMSDSDSETYKMPEYSPSTGLIFYNNHCAVCNGVHDGVLWKYYLHCDSTKDGDFVLRLPAFANLDKINENTIAAICDKIFMPPENVDVYSQVCSNELVTSCDPNTRNYSEATASGCSSGINVLFHQPFQRFPILNAFCDECSDRTDTTHLKYECPFTVKLRAGPTAFTMLIEGGVEMTTLPSTSLECDEFYVRHPMRKDDCRLLYCPVGQMRNGGICQSYTSQWATDTVTLRLILTPIDSLPVDVVTEMQIQNNPLTFLYANYLQDWQFDVQYSLDSNAKIKYLFVWLSKSFVADKFEFNSVEVLGNVNASVNGKWRLVTPEQEFLLTAEYDDEDFYIWRNKVNIYVPWHMYDDFENNVSVDTDWILYSKSQSHFETQFMPLPITRPYFCQRVQLQLGEFEFLEMPYEHRVRIMNTSRVLRHNGYTVVKDERGDNVIRVCVEDFDPDWQTHNISAGSALSPIICILCCLLSIVFQKQFR